VSYRHLGALEEEYHKGRSLLGPKPLAYKSNRDATLMAIEKPSVGIESKEHDFRVLGLEFALKGIRALSVEDGDITRWWKMRILSCSWCVTLL
jgi:hypothetical protein